MDTKKFEQSILEKIKEKKLVPRAKWRFLLKNYAVWILGLVSLLLGSFAVAVMVYLFSFNDWGIHQELDQSFLSYVIISLPYFWLAFLGLFIAFVYYDLKRTKHGYRYGLPAVLGASVLASVVLGVFFFGIGLGEAIDDILSREAPFYEKIINHKLEMWRRPGDGRLAGMVIEKNQDQLLLIFAMDRQVWQVDIGTARIMPSLELEVGRPIKVIGEMTGELRFKADLLMPVGPGREFFGRRGGAYGPPEMHRGSAPMKVWPRSDSRENPSP